MDKEKKRIWSDEARAHRMAVYQSAEYRRRQSELAQERNESPEYIRHLSDSKKKAVVRISPDTKAEKKFGSISEAAQASGVKQSWLVGRAAKSGSLYAGYLWRLAGNGQA